VTADEWKGLASPAIDPGPNAERVARVNQTARGASWKSRDRGHFKRRSKARLHVRVTTLSSFPFGHRCGPGHVWLLRVHDGDRENDENRGYEMRSRFRLQDILNACAFLQSSPNLRPDHPPSTTPASKLSSRARTTAGTSSPTKCQTTCRFGFRLKRISTAFGWIRLCRIRRTDLIIWAVGTS
jgi:hypothetical protein